MTTWALIALRLQRFELSALTAAAAVLSGASILVASILSGIASAHPHCFGLAGEGGRDCIEAQAEFAPWDQLAENLLWVGWAAPVVIGVVWAVPIVAREIEQQTAPIAWSLSLSRLRWLGGRALPVAAVTILILGMIGISAEVLTQARMAESDPGFVRYDQRGLLLPLRGGFAFGVALAVGAAIGRTLPGLIVATAISAVTLFGLNVGLDQWRTSEAEVVPIGAAPGSTIPQGMVLAPVAIMADGTVVPESRADGLPEGTFTDAVLVLPASHYWRWIGRESLALGGLAVIAAFAAVSTVRRRRPL